MGNRVRMCLVIRIGIILTFIVLLFITSSILSFLSGKDSEALSIFSFVYVILAFVLSIAYVYVYDKFPRLGFPSFLFITCSLYFTAVLAIGLWAKTEPVSDFGHLYSMAVSLKEGDLERVTSDTYMLRWAYQSFFVMYESLIIRIFPGGVTPLIVFNALFMTGIVALIYLISRSLFKENAAKYITVLYCLYPAPFFLAPVLTNQHISLFFLLLGILVLFKKYNIRTAVIGGCIIALANALRPDGSIVALALVALAVIVGMSSWRQPPKKIIKSVLPFIASLTGYFVVGILISALVVISGVNPNGQKNSYPLWKLVLGLNIDSNGGYSNEMVTKAFIVPEYSERQSVQKDIIKSHLSVDKKLFFTFLFQKTRRYWGMNEDSNWAFGGQDERVTPIIQKPLKTTLKIAKQSERFIIFNNNSCLVIAYHHMASKRNRTFIAFMRNYRNCILSYLYFH